MGIPPDMLTRVFELFTQGERSLHRSEGGLGIGLALVDRLVRLHGGRVEAQSGGRDRGSTFTVRLPLRATVPTPKDESENAKRDPAMQASRVLVVDDNKDAADSTADLLRIWGNDVRVCYDGATAADMAKSFRPHVAMLDIGLPRMDGYELARRIRAHATSRDTVLVAVTGYAQEDDIRRVREAGFAHHLVKPVDVRTLAELLAEVRRYNSEADNTATAAPISAPPNTSVG